MWWLRKSAFVVSVGVLLSFLGCGYSLNHRLRNEFSYEKGIFVPVFTNNTEEVGAEIVFTNALIRELESHGETMTNHKEKSGLQIYGTLNEIRYVTEAFQGPGYRGIRGSQSAGLHSYARIPDQIGVHVSIYLEVRDPSSSKPRWSKTLSGFRRVSAPLDRVSDQDAPSSLGMITQSIIDSSYPDIARDIMRELYDQMVDI